MTSNVQYPLDAAERGELEPFIDAHRARFTGLLLAHQFRRSGARMGAVNYGTAHTMATPILSPSIEDLSIYYQRLIDLAAADEASEKMYEILVEMQLKIETMTEHVLADISEEERRETLILIDKTLVEMEGITENMKRLSDG